MDTELERLKTCKNLCETAIILIEVNRRDLLSTIEETLGHLTQEILLDYCIKEE